MPSDAYIIQVNELISQYANNPKFLIALKDECRQLRVAGQWVKWDDTEAAKITRLGSPRLWVRMASGAEVTGEDNYVSAGAVATVMRNFIPTKPHVHDDAYEYDGDSFTEDLTRWEESYACLVEKPFCVGIYGTSVTTRAATLEEGKELADAHLREQGWILDEPDLVLLANAAHAMLLPDDKDAR